MDLPKCESFQLITKVSSSYKAKHEKFNIQQQKVKDLNIRLLRKKEMSIIYDPAT